MLYEMAKQPKIQEKLRQQVTSVLGETGEVDADSLQKIRYMRDIIKETNRCQTTYLP